ncbi:MAG: Hsp20/alpha crystallin family protein [Planctomycetaceae bacterium]|nr:Hsp20/alpha crystallin family protein [Planctomycetaceae bacterium]
MSTIHIDAAGKMARRNQDLYSWVDNVLTTTFHKYAVDRSWAPSVNLYEDSVAYFVLVDLAGVDIAAIDLSVESDRLVLSGERDMPNPPSKDKRLRMHLMEIDQGHFQRALKLPPDVNTAEISAGYRLGFLTIRLPKKG